MSVAYVTMVYNDEFFLELWLGHYRKFTNPENIYIVTHGPQPYVHEVAGDCNIVEIERDPRNPRLDQDRMSFLSTFCSELTEKHSRVVMNDVDEIIALDPDVGWDLDAYISNIPSSVNVISPLGLEIMHRFDIESDYDYSRKMFDQRQFVRMNGWYTKPNITNVPIVWGPDGHGCSHDTLYLDDNLYTFHLKWFDQNTHIRRHEERLGFRFNDEDGNEVVIGAGSWGWSEQVYRIVTNSFLRFPILPEEKSFEFSAQRERVRSSFQEGKPGMYKIHWFVEGTLHILPDRFIGMI
ncbi:hypothetical protein [Aliiroseovarius sp. PrR006]|uniref:hypothetical protein n=1 Tax=Aliiroseovarius sp. PrR006 TaxID=2706883 RepID=UPI0013D12E6A|nr:hypothetical protein [Aliiroseovarius sp. PrR006]NDW53443.1 hypothetical protein [Aliiroseovarius sp. PrR006]